ARATTAGRSSPRPAVVRRTGDASVSANNAASAVTHDHANQSPHRAESVGTAPVGTCATIVPAPGANASSVASGRPHGSQAADVPWLAGRPTRGAVPAQRGGGT